MRLPRGVGTAVSSAGQRAWPALLALIALLGVTGAAFTLAGDNDEGPVAAGSRSGAAPADESPGHGGDLVLPPNAGVVGSPAPADPRAFAEATPAPAPRRSAPPRVPEPGPAAGQPVPLVPAGEGLAAFAGLSTWIDVYDTDWTPAQQIEIARAGGAQTVFVQSGKYDSPADIHHPDHLAAVIELAHDRGMEVMIWYVPDFVDLERDYRRAQAAITFTTPRGDRADAFGLDIEVEDLPDVTERTLRLLELSTALRDWTGPDYPMAAIVLPPLQLDLRPTWWPDFPYAALGPLFDVFVPMNYSSYRGTDPETTYQWNARNIDELRRRVGDPELPVHAAGGIADNLPAVDAFVQASADSDVLGAGLYDLHTTRPDAWPQLRALRAGE